MHINIHHQSEKQIDSDIYYLNKAKNDISYFENIYKKYYILLFRFVYRRVSTEENAADIVSQVFLKAMNGIKKYKNMGKPYSAYLYKIAVNEINMFYNEKKTKRIVDIQTKYLPELIDENNEVSTVNTELLLKAIDTLNDDELNLIEMHYFEKIKYADISLITGDSVSNIKVKIHRIKKQLKQVMLY